MNKKIKCLFILISILAILLSGIITVSADESYTVNDNEQIPISEAYTYTFSMDYITNVPDGADGYLNQPEDLYYDSSENVLYIADTMNNRVLKTDLTGQCIAVFTSDGEKSFWQPKGVCTDKQGNVYIADTGNSRIVKFDKQGNFVRVYGKPDSPLLIDIEVYSPAKVSVAPNGLIYVLMGEHIMCIDENNEMRGFIGQTDIGFDLKTWFIRKFASKEQQAVLEKENADSYENFCLSSDGLIYASSRDADEGQIKVLNSVGNNIYRKLSGVSNENTAFSDFINKIFSGNIIYKKYSYGEYVDNEQIVFSDICVSENGIITVIQKNNGRLYQYDPDGILLASFVGLGKYQGEFAIPNSIVTDNDGKLYVLDYSKANIQVFEPTEFISTIHFAVKIYSTGDYESAKKLCEQILSIDETYPLAHNMLGNIAYKEGNWKSAMEEYKYVNDRTAYSNAFTEYRYEIMMKYYYIIFIVIALIAVAAYFGVRVMIRESKSVLIDYELLKIINPNMKETLLLGISTLFRPFRTMEALKGSRKRISKKIPILIFVAVFVTRIIFIYTVSYPLMDIELKDVNLMLETVKLILPPLSWVVVVYLLSSQFDGESTIGDNFTATAFSLIPYIIINLSAALLSQVLSANEKGFFALLVNGVTIWMVILLVIAVNKLNDYTVMKTLCISLVSAVAVVLLWFIVLLSYLCVTELVQFVRDIISEIQIAS